MRSFVGTSGYSYKEWRGIFYPEKLKAAAYLEYYATKLGSVEINSSFYRMPRRTTLQKWAADVPDDFRFVLKASRRITHDQKLAESDDSVAYLFDISQELGDKLGPVLFQLPPRMRAKPELLANFLKSVPEGKKVCFEFQNKTWFNDEIYSVLRDRNAALVVSDRESADVRDDEPEADPEGFTATADWGYFRLRRCDYSETELRVWRDAMKARGFGEVYVFFKHEEDGAGPAIGMKCQQILAE